MTEQSKAPSADQLRAYKDKGPVRVEFSLSHPRVRSGESCTVWAMIRLIGGSGGIRPDGIDGPGEGDGGKNGRARLPLNLALVLDRSGSMAGRKLEYVRQAACFVVDQAAGDDRLAVVTFDDRIEIPWPAQEVIYKDALKQVIRSIRDRGSTNLSGGILAGFAEVEKGLRPGQVNRMILLTDGLANVGIVDPAQIRARAREIGGGGVSVSTMGVGEGFNEDLLIGISEASGGNSYFIENPDSIPGIFARELKGLLTMLAQSVRVTVEGGTGSQVIRILGYEPAPSAGGVTVNLPDLYEHETKVLLAEISLPPLGTGRHKVCRIGCEYLAVDGGLASVRTNATVRIDVDEEGESVPDLEVMKHVRLFEGALAGDRAVEAADRGDITLSKAILTEQVVTYQNLMESLPGDETLAQEIQKLSGLIEEMDREESMTVYSRKAMRYASYSTRRSRPARD